MFFSLMSCCLALRLILCDYQRVFSELSVFPNSGPNTERMLDTNWLNG